MLQIPGKPKKKAAPLEAAFSLLRSMIEF